MADRAVRVIKKFDYANFGRKAVGIYARVSTRLPSQLKHDGADIRAYTAGVSGAAGSAPRRSISRGNGGRPGAGAGGCAGSRRAGEAIAEAVAGGEAIKTEIIGDEATGRVLVITA
jgi:hypothetical protein